MGELDDAIRDHLDLKRRRGADPAEVERLEREALGPVRRGPELEDPPPAEYARQDEGDWREPAHTSDAGYDDDYDDFDDEFEDGDDLEEHRTQVTSAPAPVDENGTPPPLEFDEDAPVVLPPDSDPYEPSTAEFFRNVPSAQEHLAPPAPGPTGGETVEYDVERAMAEHDASERTAAHREVEQHIPPAPAPPASSAPAPAPAPAPAAAERQPPEPVRDADDPLEETPEFFSETPDHDRLWFEQRPPRDFDFDG